MQTEDIVISREPPENLDLGAIYTDQLFGDINFEPRANLNIYFGHVQETMDAAGKVISNPTVRTLGKMTLGVLGVLGSANVFLFKEIHSVKDFMKNEISSVEKRLSTELGQLRADLRVDRQDAAADRRELASKMDKLANSRSSWW